MGASSGAGRALLLGLAAGSRSTLGGAPLWHSAGTGKRALMALAALGEFSGDKLPGIPSRTAAPSLTARVVSAGTGGALLARGAGASPVLATVLAAAAAPVGTLAGVGWRRYWSGTGRPAWIGGVVEDACALALARTACRGLPADGSARG
ncbi:hypothetical protein [Nocardiopsis sp. HUAS JQ3]|uniref:hypothetical protein n=1 Tax=Nocardiopsis sp. HUAS JQ3 TaxID=3061629 RepID=UPI0023A971F8|nr:hypothetical protein [Nocardiopsis sp. HUAS JQ3]WDZ88587.1 hypothetical protein PV789_16580 [Nocardiopsis sp. HUAS JQ3]